MKFSNWDEMVQSFPSNPYAEMFNIQGVFNAYNYPTPQPRNGTKKTTWSEQVLPERGVPGCLQLSDVREVAQLYWDSDERILQSFPFVEEKEGGK